MKTLVRLLATFMVVTGTCMAALQPPRELWLYCAQNLWVDRNVDELEVLFARAARAGYTHVLLSDSKFAKLGDMDARYFRNVARVKAIAATNRLTIVPAIFPIGYSNDILWHDPNLVEALPVRDASFVVANGGEARLQPETPPLLKGGDFSDLKMWDWHDATVISDRGSLLIKEPAGRNARISQKLKLIPFRQYHVSVRVKTEDFGGTPEVKLLAGGRGLNFDSLGVKRTQDWTWHHVVFNSLSNREAQIYFGAWSARGGSLWFDDAKVEEIGLVNLVRRNGAPFVVRRTDGTLLQEGSDFDPVADPHMGNKPWKGAYDVYHEPPVIHTKLPAGTELRISYYHAATVHEGQAMICPSEPKTIALLQDQARRVHAAWAAPGYMMSHDEIRVLNWCEACTRRNLDAGEILAGNVRTCLRILNEVNPGGRIYVWSDMFDPHHNARDNYYLVRGDLAGSWGGLSSHVTIVNWNFDHRAESLRFFSDRAHAQVIAAYYDHQPGQVTEWLGAAENIKGFSGVMYTTWKKKYQDLETFATILQTPKP